MLFFRKQVTIIILMAILLVWCGIFITNHNMRQMTLWSGEGPLDIQIEQDGLRVKVLGLELNKETLEPQRIIDQTKSIFARVLFFSEMKYNNLRDYLNKLRK